mgnify:CR=1 FL=1
MKEDNYEMYIAWLIFALVCLAAVCIIYLLDRVM